jgi:APA family basic amino acid/polyamine antiporter
MARDGLFFRAVGSVDPVRHTPRTALWVQCAWTSVLAISGTYSQLLDYVIFAAVLFYLLAAVALFRLRFTRPDLERPVRAPGYPWLPAVYCVLTALFLVNLLVRRPLYTWPGLIIVALGIPVYLVWKRVAAPASTPAATPA